MNSKVEETKDQIQKAKDNTQQVRNICKLSLIKLLKQTPNRSEIASLRKEEKSFNSQLQKDKNNLKTSQHKELVNKVNQLYKIQNEYVQNVLA